MVDHAVTCSTNLSSWSPWPTHPRASTHHPPGSESINLIPSVPESTEPPLPPSLLPGSEATVAHARRHAHVHTRLPSSVHLRLRCEHQTCCGGWGGRERGGDLVVLSGPRRGKAMEVDNVAGSPPRIVRGERPGQCCTTGAGSVT